MPRLRIKLSLFNILSKVVFTALFLLLMPYIVKKISLFEADSTLIEMREQVISLISDIGIEPFITTEAENAFGSYNILKEEFISIEKYTENEDVNFIEVTERLIENENITYRVLNYSFKVDGEKYLLEVGKSLDSIHHTEINTQKVMLLFLAFIILITFITDLMYTRRLLKPLDTIIRKLKNISDPSAYDNRPVKTTTNDFIRLDNALKELMDHIDKLFRKEKETTINISHELLTPVSVLRSKLENLLIRDDLSPEISMQIEESLKTLHRLQSLINSLLMIARLESRQYLHNESFSVNNVLSEIISELNPIAEDSGLLLKEEFESELQINQSNRSLLFSMFYNIINNALKNSPAGGTVIVKSFSMGKGHIINIIDAGKGFSREQMNNLFLRFKNRSENNENGTGVGLAIAKSIADFHDIKIIVKSEPDKGTVFSFIFPENS
ncbi:MAG: HAMP domain-containing sensor histidine kinase [Bacteroidia bacterium]|nr:HAMP domain-containing sensor histidine kinase [Bacteroidia bacterium]